MTNGWNQALGTILMVVLTFASSGVAAPPGDPVTGTAGVFLIRAIVREAQESREGVRTIITARLEIVHVYCGPADLLSRSFTISSPADGEQMIGQAIFPPPVRGETGIWALNFNRPKILDLHWSVFPAREKITPRFHQAERLAEAIETCCEADPTARVALLREHISSPVPEVGAWSVDTLAQAHPQVVLDIAQEARLEDLTIAAQVSLDRALAKSRGKGWMDSPQRLRLLEGWVSGARSGDEGLAGIQRLDAISQHAELDDAKLLELLGTAIRNPRLPSEARVSAVRMMGPLFLKAGAGGDAAFAALTAVVRGSDDGAIRTAAAHALKTFLLRREDRMAGLRRLAAEVDDEGLREILQEALTPDARRPH